MKGARWIFGLAAFAVGVGLAHLGMRGAGIGCMIAGLAALAGRES